MKNIKAKRGRKPVADKAVQVSIFPKKSRIDMLGIEEMRKIASQSIENEYLMRLEKNI